MRVIELDTSNKQQVSQYLDLPFQLYRGVQQWVPPLAIQARRALDRRRNPFFKHSEAAFYLALDDGGKTIGRLAVLDNRRFNDFNACSTAFFTGFECQDDVLAAAALFQAAFAWASARSLSQISGPKGFSLMEGMGLLIDGFEHRPAFGIPYNPPYYMDLIEAVGFWPAGDIVSGHLSGNAQLPDRVQTLARRVAERRGLRIACYRRRRDLRALVPQLQTLYNDSLGGTSGNVPMTDDEARALAGQLLWFADPRLIKVGFKNEQAIGFIFAYPDISAALQRCRGRLLPLGWLDLLLEIRRTRWVNINGAGIVERYRGLGGTAILFGEMCQSAREGGFEHADLVQIGTDNLPMQRELQGLGIDFYKTHRLYRRQI
jgi:hypothetical protein